MVTLTGKNKDFTAVWECNKQSYTVYYKGNVLVIKHRFNEIKSYLD